MNISSFNPLILSDKAEDIVKLFEALGFEQRHEQESLGDGDVTNVSMKDAQGHRVDVAMVPQLPQDITVLRLNVDDFEEGYELLTSRGFTPIRGTRENSILETPTSKSIMMMSPSGFGFDLCQHIK